MASTHLCLPIRKPSMAAGWSNRGKVILSSQNMDLMRLQGRESGELRAAQLGTTMDMAKDMKSPARTSGRSE